MPPEMRLTQADFNFLIQTQKNIKASKIKAFTNIGKYLDASKITPNLYS